jgi:hypothetical protein
MAEIRRQFETNFIRPGPAQPSLVLPGNAPPPRGGPHPQRLLDGRPGPTLPGGGPLPRNPSTSGPRHSATRSGWRVAQFGIEVVLIEPGPVQTPWNDVAAGSLGDAARVRPTPTRPTRPRSGLFTRAASGGLMSRARVRCGGHRRGHHPGGHRRGGRAPLSDQTRSPGGGDDATAAARTRLRTRSSAVKYEAAQPGSARSAKARSGRVGASWGVCRASFPGRVAGV